MLYLNIESPNVKGNQLNFFSIINLSKKNRQNTTENK